jgi:hypothetical protein
MTNPTLVVRNIVPLPRTAPVVGAILCEPGQWPRPAGDAVSMGAAGNGVLRDVRLWSDGSVRAAAIDCPACTIDAGETYQVAVEPATATGFLQHPALREAAERGFGLQPARYTLVATLEREHTTAAKTFVSRWRRDESWAEVEVTFFSGSPIAYADLRWGVSDPRTERLTAFLPRIQFSVHGAEPVVRHGSTHATVERSSAEWRITVDDAREWGDAQSGSLGLTLLFWSRDLSLTEQVSMMAERYGSGASPLLAMPGSGLKGISPLLTRPPAAPHDPVELYRGGERGSWDAPALGLNKAPTSTGPQKDFGSFNEFVLAAAQTRDPAFLLPLDRSVRQSARRPVWHREVDVRPFVASEHPECFFWVDRPHANDTVSPDQLGKTKSLSTSETAGWGGTDRAHYSENLLTGYYLLSGDRAARRMLDDRCEHWKAAMWPDAPSPVMQGVGSPREARAYQAGAMLAWASGREDVAEVLAQRCDHNHRRLWEDGGQGCGPRDPRVYIAQPNPNSSSALGQHPYVSPWELGLHVKGQWFARRLFDHTGGSRRYAAAALIDEMLPVICAWQVENGWQQQPQNGDWWLATAVHPEGQAVAAKINSDINVTWGLSVVECFPVSEKAAKIRKWIHAQRPDEMHWSIE